jgi:hypothetical protein
MGHRYAFVKNRTAHLMSTGLNEEHAKAKANNDFRRMSSLASECVMTGAHDALPGKGITRCNRTACQSDKHVVFFNSVMHKNYCVNCATDIRFCNDLNELDLYPEYNESLDKLLEATEQ